MNGAYPVSIEKLNESERQSYDDLVAIEEPLEIRLRFLRKGVERTQPVAITMRTPGHDYDLTLGFLLTERLVRHAADVVDIVHCDDGDNTNVVRATLAPGVDVDVKKLQRNFYVTSSCGVCGKASIDALELVGYETVEQTFTTTAPVLTTIPQRLHEAQPLFRATGGNHGAGLFDASGTLRFHAEDVGRHNAVDKVLGAAFRNRTDEPLMLALSGRASFELVQKALAAKVELVAAVGAPSSLAVETAERFGITLVGFLNAKRANLYTHSHRVR